MFIQPDTVPMGLTPTAAPTLCSGRTRLQHIGVVLGGLRSWSARHQLPEGAALSRAMACLLEIVHHCITRKTRRLTVFVFRDDIWPSTSRHNRNVAALTLRFLKATLTTLHAKGVQIRVTGDFANLHGSARTLALQAEEITVGNTGMELVIALDGYQANLDDTCTTSSGWARLPQPELVVRTGGHLPVAYPMFWDTSETALYVTDLSWPELDLNTFRAALQWFRRPDRGSCSILPRMN